MIVLGALLLLSGVASAAYVHEFNYTRLDSTDRARLTLVATGSQPTLGLRLVDALPQQNAAAWTGDTVLVRGFDVSFSITVSNSHQGITNHYDGMAFVVQGASPSAIGSTVGAGLGYGGLNGNDGGITNCIAVEFDTHRDAIANDGSDNAVSLHVREEHKQQPTKKWHASADEIHSLSEYKTLAPLAGRTASFHISYAPGDHFRVYEIYSGGAFSAPYIDIKGFLLEDYMNLLTPAGQAYIGFTASTNATGESFTVESWGYRFKGQPDSSKSVPSGDGTNKAVAGSNALIKLQLVDQFGNNYVSDPQPKVDIDLDPKPLDQPSVKYAGDGVYALQYNTTKAGTTKVSVTIDGANIQQSPFVVAVKPACASMLAPANTKLDGDGWPVNSHNQPRVVSAGNVQTLTVALEDVWGNQCDDNLHTVEFQAIRRGGAPITVSGVVVNGKPGVYNVSYTPQEVGIYDLHVLVNHAMLDQEAAIQVVPAAVDPINCPVIGKVNHAVAGKNETLSVVAYDAYKNRVFDERAALLVTFTYHAAPLPTPMSTSSTSTASTTSTSSTTTSTTSTTQHATNAHAKRNIDDCYSSFPQIRNGTYTFHYSCKRTGLYTLDIRLDGASVMNMPTDLHVRSGNVDSAHCIASGGVLQAGAQTIATDSAKFHLLAVDESQNPIDGDDLKEGNVEMKVNNATVSVKLQYIGTQIAGTYEITFPLEHAGENVLEIQVNNSTISNFKNKVTVLPAPALPSKCSASGPGLAGGQANTYLPVLIELRDQFGNELLSNGNHSLTATFRHAEEVLDGTVDITNNNNGSYTLKVSGRKSGEWKLSVQVDQQTIAGSPFSIHLKFGLGTGALVGIGFGVVAVLLAAAFVVFHFRKKSRGQFTWERL